MPSVSPCYQYKMHSNEFKGSFFVAIGPILQISQWFGLMPADGVNSKNISKHFECQVSMEVVKIALQLCVCRLWVNRSDSVYSIGFASRNDARLFNHCLLPIGFNVGGNLSNQPRNEMAKLHGVLVSKREGFS